MLPTCSGKPPMTENRLSTGSDGLPRCFWCGIAPEFEPYHDHEWGFPVADDRRLFEKLSLELFQSGLSWRTILNKRDGFRAGFAGFEMTAVARFGEADVARLLGDPGIVRHRGKIEAVMANAAAALKVQDAFGSLAAYLWRHAFSASPVGKPSEQAAECQGLSKDLKRRGFKFVGPTTVYAFMQAAGLVNDHDPRCSVHARAAAAREAFVLPS